jgi:triosephosphate isomerase
MAGPQDYSGSHRAAVEGDSVRSEDREHNKLIQLAAAHHPVWAIGQDIVFTEEMILLMQEEAQRQLNKLRVFSISSRSGFLL